MSIPPGTLDLLKRPHWSLVAVALVGTASCDRSASFPAVSSCPEVRAPYPMPASKPICTQIPGLPECDPPPRCEVGDTACLPEPVWDGQVCYDPHAPRVPHSRVGAGNLMSSCKLDAHCNIQQWTCSHWDPTDRNTELPYCGGGTGQFGSGPTMCEEGLRYGPTSKEDRQDLWCGCVAGECRLFAQ